MGTKPGTCEGWAGRHSIRVIGWGLQEEGRVTLVHPLGPDKMDSAVSSAPGSSVLHSVQGLRLHKLTIQITPSTHLVIDIRYPACSKAEHRMSKESVTGRTGVTMRKAGHKARSWRPGPHSRDGPSALGNWVQGRLAEQNSRSGTKSASNQHTASKGKFVTEWPDAGLQKVRLDSKSWISPKSWRWAPLSWTQNGPKCYWEEACKSIRTWRILFFSFGVGSA